MSRGPGAVQRYILDRVNDKTGPQLTPVRVLATGYARDTGSTATSHLHASARRAALALARAGKLRAWTAPLRTFLHPQAPARRVLVVGPATMEQPTPDQLESAEFLMMTFGTKQTPPVEAAPS